jgi:hypothetical protein
MRKKNIFRKSSTNVFYQGYKVRGKKSPNESIVFLSLLLDNLIPRNARDTSSRICHDDNSERIP